MFDAFQSLKGQFDCKEAAGKPELNCLGELTDSAFHYSQGYGLKEMSFPPRVSSLPAST